MQTKQKKTKLETKIDNSNRLTLLIITRRIKQIHFFHYVSKMVKLFWFFFSRILFFNSQEFLSRMMPELDTYFFFPVQNNQPFNNDDHHFSIFFSSLMFCFLKLFSHHHHHLVQSSSEFIILPILKYTSIRIHSFFRIEFSIIFICFFTIFYSGS